MGGTTMTDLSNCKNGRKVRERSGNVDVPTAAVVIERIEAHRRREGLSKKQHAILVGCEPATYASWSRPGHEQMPQLKYVIGWAELYHTSVGELCGLEAHPSQQVDQAESIEKRYRKVVELLPKLVVDERLLNAVENIVDLGNGNGGRK